MLVLSRAQDETIRIGEDISIVVVEIRGDRVRIGIVAPKSVPVHRQEVFEAIRRHRQPENTGTIQAIVDSEECGIARPDGM